jgi:hypothetical protein
MRWAELAALGALTLGCASPPDENACASIRSVEADGGYRDDASGAWASSGWAGPHILAPAYTTLRLRHGLGRTPVKVTCYASFSASGGNLAEQIGNACTIIPSCNGSSGVTDESVLFRNGGGQDFYYRFVFE